MSGSPNCDDPTAFRAVPRTGVIYVMAEAMERGFRYGHPDWVNLGQGAPETGPIPGAHPRIENIAIPADAHEYAPVSGLRDLREAVAALYNARYRAGLPSQYTAENVAISAGGRAGLTRIAAALGSIHLGHFLPDYTAYEELLDIFKAFVPIPILLDEADGFALDARRLRSEIVGKGLGGILLSNPSNPTGQLVGPDAMDQWVSTCRETGCWAIVDEFYSHYIYDGGAGDRASVSACASVEDVNKDPVVVLDGLTKNWRYPGWRLSWTLGPKKVIERLASAGSFLDGGAPHLIQRAALPLLEPDVADREARAIQRAFSAKRDVMVTRARALGLRVSNPPRGAFYCFAGLDGLHEDIQDGMDFFRRALEHRVIVVPGVFFDVNPGQRRSHIPSRLRSFVRLSFGPSMDVVERGLDRLREMIGLTGRDEAR
jgi:aspartate/methionine/tyrosine aminotransferase